MNLFHKMMNMLGRYRLIPDRVTGQDYMHFFLRIEKNFRLTLRYIKL